MQSAAGGLETPAVIPRRKQLGRSKREFWSCCLGNCFVLKGISRVALGTESLAINGRSSGGANRDDRLEPFQYHTGTLSSSQAASKDVTY
jgi:hypothetical protein